MGKPYRKWAEVKAELMEEAEFSQEWEETKPFRQIASEVIRVRCEKGLTQKELAGLIGTTTSAISRLESLNYGRVTLTTLVKIAKALNLELDVRFRDAG